MKAVRRQSPMATTCEHRTPLWKQNSVVLAAVTLLSVVVFFGPTDNWRWDPSFYYAQLRSPIIDRDFDFSDETLPANGVSRRTPIGLQPSGWPVGPGILWSPYFLTVHAIVRLTGNGLATKGLEPPYIAAVAAG